MTEPATIVEDPYEAAKARRRSARRVMRIVTVVCILAAAGVGADQFATGGLHSFLDRPAGVGATPPNPSGK